MLSSVVLIKTFDIRIRLYCKCVPCVKRKTVRPFFFLFSGGIGCAPRYTVFVAHHVKSERVRSLLLTTDHSARDIADICECSYTLVTHERRKLRLRSERDTLARRVSMLEERVRDLERIIASLGKSRRYRLATPGVTLARAGKRQ